MNLATFGELTDGVLTLHPVFTAEQFDGVSFPESVEFSSLEIDGKSVEQCDSVGIAALIWLIEKARERNVPLIWKNLPPAITHLLDLYELDLSGLTQYARTIN